MNRFKDLLKEKILITDGAMGTYYQSLYPEDEDIVERAVMTHPDRIKAIHRSYIDAGATLIRSDSFAVSGPFIEDDTEKVQIARTAFSLAKKAVDESGKDCLPVADIGTIFDPAMEGHIFSDYSALIKKAKDENP